MKMVKIFLLLLLVAPCAIPAEIIPLGETPVAEFTLPDGSVLKNAFVWRRSSEGLMIVHDDGQFFLNFSVLPADWKAAYLGEPDPGATNAPTEEVIEVDDRYKLDPVLKTIPELSPKGRQFVLREQADPFSEKGALVVALLQSLLSGKNDEAQRINLIIEEKGLEIEAVERDALFDTCGKCGGEGTLSRACPSCEGSGKCVKCGGEGLRKTGIGNSTVHCTTCRGTGKCPGCGGAGVLNSTCRACGGRGKVVDQSYCEVKRDQLVHTINALANKEKGRSITQIEAEDVGKVLKELPGLDPAARAFYLSKAYDGSMDTNILVACVIHSMLKERWGDAERFHTMVQVYNPKGDVLEVEDYLKPCKTCDKSGRIEKPCAACDGSGKCPRCGGTGERKTDFRESTIHCTTCRGTGKCVECGGDGKKSYRCAACEGRGRMLEIQRAEIKRDLLVDEINDYFNQHPVSIPGASY